MPGRGRVVEREYTPEERQAISAGAVALGLDPAVAFSRLGDKTCDIYLNDRAYWRCVPAKVWGYYIGGYQVIKKWLSYREKELLGRPITKDEKRNVTEMARRGAAAGRSGAGCELRVGESADLRRGGRAHCLAENTGGA